MRVSFRDKLASSYEPPIRINVTILMKSDAKKELIFLKNSTTKSGFYQVHIYIHSDMLWYSNLKLERVE